MANFNISTITTGCNLFWTTVNAQNGLNQNQDGTLSVYIKNSNNVVAPVQITEICCNVLRDSGNSTYYFDRNTQKCRWSTKSNLDCGYDKPFKIVLNPVGNDGAIFAVDDDEISALTVEFDYLFKFDCESLAQKISPVVPINPQIAKDIKALQDQISAQTVICEDISSKIAYQENLFSNTRYSIANCDLISVDDYLVVEGQTVVPSTVVTTSTYNSTIILTTPIAAPAKSFLAPIDLSNIGNTILNNTFLNTRTPVSNLFVPKIPRRPDLANQTVLQSTTGTTPTLAVPRVELNQAKQKIINSPLRQVLTNPTPTQKQIVPFTRTGFGTGFTIGTPPFSFPSTIYSTSNGTFCITEPDGLNQWALILGPDRFNRFINGDETSYTCSDVAALYNATAGVKLMVICDTPFGTKTNIQTQLNSLYAQQKACQDVLNSLSQQLQALQTANTADIDICGTPISVLENLNVTATIEVINIDGTLTKAYEYNLFNTIGAGNLYNYLVSSRDKSGFFICGQPMPSETWADGCTSLIYPEFLGKTTDANVTSCSKIKNYFADALYTESGLSAQTNGVSVFNTSLTNNIFSSNWLRSKTVISDKTVMDSIKNKKIKLSIKVNTNCGDLCILVDRIKLEKNITTVTGNNIFLSTSPGFKMSRIVDNKKSWLASTKLTNRNFFISDVNNNNPIRQTNYDIDDERLIINSKEIDLAINIANGIETDFWNFASTNPCLFVGRPPVYDCTDPYNYWKQFQDRYCFDFEDDNLYTFMDDEPTITINTEVPKDFQNTYYDDFYYQDSILYTFNGGGYITSKCGDDKLNFRNLITSDLRNVSTVQDFNDVMTSEFIDAKNRQTIISYGTLRALYERYLNSGSYCNTISNKFDYMSINNFADLLNNHWIDIIEQVVPSTTIWGNGKVYRNTIFDEQKFKYRSYTFLYDKTYLSGVTLPSPISDTYGMCDPVEVITSTINIDNSVTTNTITAKYDFINVAQMNTSSEFVGRVIITKPIT